MSAERLEKLIGLKELRGSVRVVSLDICDSTSNEAKRRAERGEEAPLIVISDGQTAGRGRMGKSFYSPNGTGLYMTVLFDAEGKSESIVMLTAAAAVAVSRAIDSLCGIRTEIKWVNDIYLGGKKVCGILCESFMAAGKRFISVGIGINLTTESFPDELSGTAASLMAKGTDRLELAAKIYSNLFGYYENMPSEEIIKYYRERSCVLSRRVRFVENQKEYRGRAIDIDSFGRLLVELDSGERKWLCSGEITLRAKED